MFQSFILAKCLRISQHNQCNVGDFQQARVGGRNGLLFLLAPLQFRLPPVPLADPVEQIKPPQPKLAHIANFMLNLMIFFGISQQFSEKCSAKKKYWKELWRYHLQNCLPKYAKNYPEISETEESIHYSKEKDFSLFNV